MMEQSARVIKFIETFLSLSDSFAGEPWKVLDCQRQIIEDLYRSENGRRRYRTYLLGLARKNAKSQIAAAIALYELFFGEDTDRLVVTAANDRHQARMVWDKCAQMIMASPDLAAVAQINRSKHTITTELNGGGTLMAVSADAGRQHGLNISTLIYDEMHASRTGDLWDALTTGSGMRANPLFLAISTAGVPGSGPLWELYEHGQNVKSGMSQDTSFGMAWFGPPEGKFDYRDEKVWYACNPLLQEGLMSLEDMRADCAGKPEASFIRYRLNGWTSARNAWLPAGAWAGLTDPSRSLQPDASVILGFDGAWRRDLSALVACSTENGRIEVLGVWDSGQENIRHEVREAIAEACGFFNVREIAADPYWWHETMQDLSDEGLPIVEFNTNSLPLMTKAIQSFWDGVKDETISHDGSQVLAQHLDNCELIEARNGLKLAKSSPTQKIDAAVAAVIAHYRAVTHEEVPERAPLKILLFDTD